MKRIIIFFGFIGIAGLMLAFVLLGNDYPIGHPLVVLGFLMTGCTVGFYAALGYRYYQRKQHIAAAGKRIVEIHDIDFEPNRHASDREDFKRYVIEYAKHIHLPRTSVREIQQHFMSKYEEILINYAQAVPHSPFLLNVTDIYEEAAIEYINKQ